MSDKLSVLSESYCMRTGQPKPPIPYTPGKELLVRSHEPSVPTRIIKCPVNPDSAHEREQMHPLDRCLRHTPPIKGSPGQTQVGLKVTGTIQVGDNKSAQVVVVQVQSSTSKDLPEGKTLLAKIYDPLYHTDQDDVDPFLSMDRDYRSETAAYNALRELQGGIIPWFNGSFTSNLPAKDSRFRGVYLTLLELICGTSMAQLKPADFTRPDRQKIMKEVIDAESLIYKHNIFHMDPRPSNVVICRDGSGNKNGNIKRVVIIDFGQCFIGRNPAARGFASDHFLPGVAISPLLRWKRPRGSFDTWGAWIDWNWTAWLNAVYGYTRSSITPHMRSIWDP